ncbi:MAG: prepilin-type N-terminal cleavage/methylation domain-containing protein [Deltaproteobacteria bacterium]|nr:prepilin-type N-terminal cleavage/methylation domain-containing protein [Deltaproteobacteria bacterium]
MKKVKGETKNVRREMKGVFCSIRNLYPVLRLTSHGFTLLEIMIALAILSFSLLSLYSGMGNSLRASAEAEQTEKAVQLARGRMAEIRIGLDEEMARGAFPDEKEENGVFEKPFEDYRWAYSIKKVEIPFISPQLLGKEAGLDMGQASEKSGSTGQNSTPGIDNIVNNLAQAVTKKISESIRELKVTVFWGEEGEGQDKLVLTTHLVKLK